MDKQIDYLQSHALHLQQQMLTQKMQNVAGQALCVLFVEYLERFAINTPYSCVQQLLAQHGFDQDEIDSFVGVLYQGGNLDAGIERKMKLTLHS